MTRIRGIVFDKDGTLFDFQATWGAWSRRLIEEESRGDPGLRDRLADLLGYDLATGRFRPDSVAIAATTRTVAEHLLPVLPDEDLEALIARMDARAAEAPQVEAAPLAELMERLEGMGLALGVATNDSEGPARVHLEEAGVADRFAFVAGFDSGWGAKPGPGQLLAFAEAAGLHPGECVMVGDSLHDLHAAQAAGMTGVAVLTGPIPRDVLAPAAAAVLASIADLPDWLRGRI
ncbi:HAD family hydrolase [Rubellimicrobium sp. CFH 75288]|uniref:HAD family hydrolase n=1 Tax=Rubellimicrobium sp. CFH 75288 TaxID=2697034 RepID=UPI0014121DF4|nr:HAD family hydrolase [Rubellimicrobium sp. CFH 75288]NAZ35256.1 HAD-IA family hydrolase [Rubellimicrobium sp. CFH 75288]